MKKRQSRVQLRESGAAYRKEAAGGAAKLLTRSYTVVPRWLRTAGRYEIEFPGAPNVVTSGTPTIRGSLKRARAALTVHLQWLLEDGEALPADRRPRPRARRGDIVQTIRVQS